MQVRKGWVAVFAATAAAAGCGDSNKPAEAPAPEPTAATVIQPGAPGEPSREVVAAPSATPFAGGFVDADVRFMQMMIHHHQQALKMTAWVPDRTGSTSVRVMARRMEVSQTDEIELMRNWLRERKIDPDDHSHDHSVMPGYLSTAQLEELENAKGKAFDRLFLRYMSMHHEGAITMVRELREDGGALESEIEQFAMHVESDQEIEIKRMQDMLRG